MVLATIETELNEKRNDYDVSGGTMIAMYHQACLLDVPGLSTNAPAQNVMRSSGSAEYPSSESASSVTTLPVFARPPEARILPRGA